MSLTRKKLINNSIEIVSVVSSSLAFVSLIAVPVILAAVLIDSPSDKDVGGKAIPLLADPLKVFCVAAPICLGAAVARKRWYIEDEPIREPSIIQPLQTLQTLEKDSTCFSCEYRSGSILLPCAVNPMGYGQKDCPHWKEKR